jgi:hypothetical protein
VYFTQTDASYVPRARPPDAKLVFRHDRIERPHRVVGVIHAELDRRARKVELDGLLAEKAREIGADGVMLVEYDIDRDVYLEHHHAVVGRGPWRRHVVGTHKRVEVKKAASGIAVIFE